MEGNTSRCTAEPINVTVVPGGNRTDSTNGLQLIYKPYELVWTRDVVFRVSMIVIVMVLTLIGNTTLLCTIAFQKKLRRKRVNIFLMNLALGDLMVCFVTMTTEILFVAFGEWVLGAIACKLIVYGQMITLASATFLLTGMSIDRYQVIVKPLKSLTGPPKIWRKVLVAWILSLVFTCPQLFIFVETNEGVHPDGAAKHMCRSAGYTAQWQRKLYFSYQTTCILLIPTVIMSFCYINIIRVVWMRTGNQMLNQPRNHSVRFTFKLRPKQRQTCVAVGSRLSVPNKMLSASKRNVIKMTLSVIIGFVVCWSPYFVISLIRIFSDYEYKMEQALSVAEIMALIHSAMNPILYGMFSTKAVRSMFGAIFRCCGRARSNQSPPDNSLVSDEETCETSWEARHTTLKAAPGCHVQALAATKVKPTGFLHISERLRQACGVSRKSRKPGDRKLHDSSIPLLIYGRLLNGQVNNQISSGHDVDPLEDVTGRDSGRYNMNVRQRAEEPHTSQLIQKESEDAENADTAQNINGIAEYISTF